MNTQASGDPICSVCGFYTAWHRKNCVQSNCVGFLDKPIGSINPVVNLISTYNNLKKNNMKITNVVKGLQIIEQYEEDAIVTSDHEIIWVGQGNGKSVSEITEEGRLILESLGWTIDESLGCWSILI